MKQVSQSEILAKLMDGEGRAAWEAGKGKEVQLNNFGDLPPGVSGVAQLVDIRLRVYDREGGKYNGKPYLYAVGVMVSPETFTDAEGNKHRIKNRQTRQMIDLFDKPESQAKGATKKAGIEKMMDLVGGLLGTGKRPTSDPTQLPALFTALLKAKPHFSVRTWAGNRQDVEQDEDGPQKGKWFVIERRDRRSAGRKVRGPFVTQEQAKKAAPYAGQDPRTQHSWEGQCEWEPKEDTQATGVEEDVTLSRHPGSNGAAVEFDEDGDGLALRDGDSGYETPATDEEPGLPDDVGALGELAQGGDEGAQTRLTELGEPLGVDPNLHESWTAVADAITETQAEPSGGDEEPDDGETLQQAMSPGRERLKQQYVASEAREPATVTARPRGATTAAAPSRAPDVPLVGKVYAVSRKGLDGKARVMKVVLDSVDLKTRTAGARDVDTRKVIFKGLKWSELRPI